MDVLLAVAIEFCLVFWAAGQRCCWSQRSGTIAARYTARLARAPVATARDTSERGMP